MLPMSNKLFIIWDVYDVLYDIILYYMRRHHNGIDLWRIYRPIGTEAWYKYNTFRRNRESFKTLCKTMKMFRHPQLYIDIICQVFKHNSQLSTIIYEINETSSAFDLWILYKLQGLTNVSRICNNNCNVMIYFFNYMYNIMRTSEILLFLTNTILTIVVFTTRV